MRHGTAVETCSLYLQGYQLRNGPKNPVHSLRTTVFIFHSAGKCQNRTLDSFSPTPYLSPYVYINVI